VNLQAKRILLIVSGGIAAYKALELIRLITKAGGAVTCVLTQAGSQFVTPLSLQALSGGKVYTDLFSLTDESEMGHIELSRSADLVAVVPATANILAKMAAGICDDLATTLLLATDKRVLAAPAMNVRMWEHPATLQSMETLRQRGVLLVPPTEGKMACGEFGYGRLAEPETILAAIAAALGAGGSLSGKHAIVTSGPTHEPIDPVRYLANRSSGRQGHAIAAALAALGARVTLVSGPVHIPDPPGVATIHVETAAEMFLAVQAALPADIAVCAAAVADWRAADVTDQKIKKTGATPPTLALAENPDILAAIAAPGTNRPRLVIGFAAETQHLLSHASAKRNRKNADWIVANDVGGTGIMGGESNEVILITQQGPEIWPKMSKVELAERLAARIANIDVHAG
jgi:phosphopantothenoylcysteine decarboxylase/phosphopantothenate--cysteine ligase